MMGFYEMMPLGSFLKTIEDAPLDIQHFAVSGTYRSTHGVIVNLSFTYTDTLDILKRYLSYNAFFPKADVLAYMEDHSSTKTEAFAALFTGLWSRWEQRNVQNLVDAMGAYTEEYDPLVNNFLKEEITEGYQQGNTEHEDSWSSNYAETDTFSSHGLTSASAQGKSPETTDYTYGVDSDANGSPQSRTAPSTVSGAPSSASTSSDNSVSLSGTTPTNWTESAGANESGGENTKTKTGTHSLTDKPSNTQGLAPIAGNTGSEQYHNTHDFYHTRSGNLGEMTSQAMLREEIETRSYDLLRDFVNRFVHDNMSMGMAW